MKMRKIFLCMVFGVILTGCGIAKPGQNDVVPIESKPIENALQEESKMQETVVPEETLAKKSLDENLYIGEYLDYDNNEPNLEIAKGEDGKYIVQIGIFRLASFDDGVGELTEEGMHFTATDMAGNPISGMITIEGQIATVTFTDSTWELIENGTCYQYAKSSDEPKLWETSY